MSKAGSVILKKLPGTNLKFHKSTVVTLEGYPVELATISNFEQFTDTGLIGGALNASQEKGEKVLDAVADYLAEVIRELKKL